MRNDEGFTPYGWWVNRPNPDSQDFKNVIAWLQQKGVSIAPKIGYIMLDAGGFQRQLPGDPVNPGPILQLIFNGYSSPMDGALVLNSPGVVLSMLGLVPAGTIPTYTPPIPPDPGPAPPPGQPVNPIGNYWFTDRDGMKCHYPAPGDVLPDHSLWPSAHPVAIKVRIDGLGGPTQYWKALRLQLISFASPIEL